MWFPITAPDGTEVWPIAPEGWEGRWVLSLETWKQREKQGLTQWIKRSYGWMPYYIETAPNDPGIPWPTIWTEVDQNRQAKAEFTDLMGPGVEFDNPKPSSLIKEVLKMATAGDDICMDFFAGSGTTAQAVLDLNHEDGSNRRFVVVQLPEQIARDGSSSPLQTIADLARTQIRKRSPGSNPAMESATQTIPKGRKIWGYRALPGAFECTTMVRHRGERRDGIFGAA